MTKTTRAPKAQSASDRSTNSDHEEAGLTAKATKGGVWVIAARGFGRILGLARLVILARLLSPEDFGLVGTALLMISTMEAFSQTGFEAALIQKKEDINEYLDSAWTVLVLRGIVLFLLLYFSAPFVAVFFAEPAATPVIRVSGLSILLHAFANIGITYFLKELDFKKQFAYESSGILVDFAVAAFVAIMLRNAWALVLGLLAGNLTSLILSYVIHPYKPRLHLDADKARELFGYGKWVLGSKIMSYMGVHVPKIAVGRLLGVTALGHYEMAYHISNTPATEITYAVGRVAFPAYSKLQDSPDKLQAVYFKITRLTVAVSAPLAIGILLLAPDFTRVFLGEKWLPMVPAMQLLALAGLVKSVVSTGSPLFAGSGYPKCEFYMQLIRGVMVSLAIYPLTMYADVFGAALSVLIGSVGMVLIWYPSSRQITRTSWLQYVRTLGPPLISSLLMAASLYLTGLVWNPVQQALVPTALVLLITTSLSVFVYAATMYLTDLRQRELGIASDIQQIYRSLRTR